ncbi:MAG: hypothetical protein ACFFAU_13955 [Candidatus Hodarchaeota archaeon]
MKSYALSLIHSFPVLRRLITFLAPIIEASIVEAADYEKISLVIRYNIEYNKILLIHQMVIIGITSSLFTIGRLA